MSEDVSGTLAMNKTASQGPGDTSSRSDSQARCKRSGVKLLKGKLVKGKLPKGKLPKGKLPKGKLPKSKLSKGKGQGDITYEKVLLKLRGRAGSCSIRAKAVHLLQRG